MPDRRFTEEEAQRVFAAVAERQGRARADEAGLSLAEMQEAAAASGLDPALVVAVVAEMGAGDVDEMPSFLGAPLAVRKARVLPMEINDATWTRIVTELRRAYDTPGTPTELGNQREWTSGGGVNGAPVHLVAVPSDGKTVITLEQTIAKDSKGAGWIVPGSVIPTTLLAAFFYFAGGLGPEIWLLPVLMGAICSLIVIALWAMWRSWGTRTDHQFERVLDRIDLAARDAHASGAEPSLAEMGTPAPEAPRLDLDALPDASGETATDRTRTKTQT